MGKKINYISQYKGLPKCPLLVKDEIESFTIETDRYCPDMKMDGYIDYACKSVQRSQGGSFSKTTAFHYLKDGAETYQNYCSNNYKECERYNEVLEVVNKSYNSVVYSLLYLQSDHQYFIETSAKIVIGFKRTYETKYINFEPVKTFIREEKNIILNRSSMSDEMVLESYYKTSTFELGEYRDSYSASEQAKKDKANGYHMKYHEFIFNEYEYNRLVKEVLK